MQSCLQSEIGYNFLVNDIKGPKTRPCVKNGFVLQPPQQISCGLIQQYSELGFALFYWQIYCKTATDKEKKCVTWMSIMSFKLPYLA